MISHRQKVYTRRQHMSTKFLNVQPQRVGSQNYDRPRSSSPGDPDLLKTQNDKLKHLTARRYGIFGNRPTVGRLRSFISHTPFPRKLPKHKHGCFRYISFRNDHFTHHITGAWIRSCIGALRTRHLNIATKTASSK